MLRVRNGIEHNARWAMKKRTWVRTLDRETGMGKLWPIIGIKGIATIGDA